MVCHDMLFQLRYLFRLDMYLPWYASRSFRPAFTTFSYSPSFVPRALFSLVDYKNLICRANSHKLGRAT